MVYFIKAEGTPFIKIGYSENVHHRLTKMQADCPLQLTVIKVIEGDQESEKLLHKIFAAYHHKGEWFDITEKMIDEIEDYLYEADSFLWKRLRDLLDKKTDINSRVLLDNFTSFQIKILKQDEHKFLSFQEEFIWIKLEEFFKKEKCVNFATMRKILEKHFTKKQARFIDSNRDKLIPLMDKYKISIEE